MTTRFELFRKRMEPSEKLYTSETIGNTGFKDIKIKIYKNTQK